MRFDDSHLTFLIALTSYPESLLAAGERGRYTAQSTGCDRASSLSVGQYKQVVKS